MCDTEKSQAISYKSRSVGVIGLYGYLRYAILFDRHAGRLRLGGNKQLNIDIHAD